MQQSQHHGNQVGRWLALTITATFTLGACAAGAPTATTAPAASATSGNSAAGAFPKTDLTIGAILSLTGAQGPFGVWLTPAAQLGEKVLNDAAKAAGLPFTVTLKIEDEQGKPDAATAAATKLVTADGATCLVGGQTSADTIAIANSVSTPRKVPQISYLSTSPTMTTLADDGYLFRTHPSDTKQSVVLGDLAAKGLGGATGKKLNIGARNDDFGANLANGVKAQFESLGGTVGNVVLWDPAATLYDADAAKLVEGSPDGWVIIDFVTTFQKVAPSLVRTGNWDPKRTFVTALQVPTLPELVGKEATEGMRGLAPGVAADTAASRAFDETWKGFTQATRGAADVNTFDAVLLCGLAAVAAKSKDGTAIRDALTAVSGPGGDKYDFTKLSDAMKALAAGTDIDYVGAYGEIDWDANGDTTGGTYGVIEFKDGKLVRTDVLTVP